MSMNEELLLLKGQGKKQINYTDGWLDVNEPQVVFFQGKRKAGKGVAIAECIEKMYKAGFTIFHAWAARMYDQNLHLHQLHQLYSSCNFQTLVDAIRFW